MKNKEKYADKILEIACNGDMVAIDKRTNELRGCRGFSCSECLFDGKCKDRTKEWCEQEYEEYETDWSKVPVDTPVLAKFSNKDGSTIFKRHFCKYTNNKVYCWNDGKTSFSATNDDITFWEYTELANEEDKIKYRKAKGE